MIFLCFYKFKFACSPSVVVHYKACRRAGTKKQKHKWVKQKRRSYGKITIILGFQLQVNHIFPTERPYPWNFMKDLIESWENSLGFLNVCFISLLNTVWLYLLLIFSVERTHDGKIKLMLYNSGKETLNLYNIDYLCEFFLIMCSLKTQASNYMTVVDEKNKTFYFHKHELESSIG